MEYSDSTPDGAAGIGENSERSGDPFTAHEP